MNSEEYSELRQLIASLAERIYNLERRAGLQTPQAPTISSQPPPQPASRLGKKEDLESAIGANWLNRLGIVAILIGVSYFLKYAFDNAWIGPAGRVVIGLLIGLGIVYWSEYFRHKAYSTFSYSLKAVGLGILYLSLWASSQLYPLVSTEIAFVGMVTVTTCSIAMALLLNSEIIAGFASLGAFLTPILLSTGENQALSLFAYIAMLDFGLLLLWRRRPWSRVASGTFAGTVILTAIWYAGHYTADQFLTAFIYSSVIFAIFLALPFFGRNRDSGGLSFLAVANAGMYFVWTWNLFDSIGQARIASVCAVVLATIYFFGSSAHWSTALAHLYRSLGISLLIVAVPVGLEAQWITIGWLVEAGALMWASHRTGHAPSAQLGAIALIMGLTRLIMLDRFTVTRFVFNERMLVYAVAVVVLIGISTMIAAGGTRIAAGGTRLQLRTLPVLIVSINILVLLALDLEIVDAFRRQLQGATPSAGRSLRIARDFAYSALWMFYGAGLMFIGFWKHSRFFRWQALLLIAVTIVKVFLYDTISLDRGYRILSFIGLGLLLLGTSFFYQRDWFKLKDRTG